MAGAWTLPKADPRGPLRASRQQTCQTRCRSGEAPTRYTSHGAEYSQITENLEGGDGARESSHGGLHKLLYRLGLLRLLVVGYHSALCRTADLPPSRGRVTYRASLGCVKMGRVKIRVRALSTETLRSTRCSSMAGGSRTFDAQCACLLGRTRAPWQSRRPRGACFSNAFYRTHRSCGLELDRWPLRPSVANDALQLDGENENGMARDFGWPVGASARAAHSPARASYQPDRGRSNAHLPRAP